MDGASPARATFGSGDAARYTFAARAPWWHHSRRDNRQATLDHGIQLCLVLSAAAHAHCYNYHEGGLTPSAILLLPL